MNVLGILSSQNMLGFLHRPGQSEEKHSQDNGCASYIWYLAACCHLSKWHPKGCQVDFKGCVLWHKWLQDMHHTQVPGPKCPWRPIALSLSCFLLLIAVLSEWSTKPRMCLLLVAMVMAPWMATCYSSSCNLFHSFHYFHLFIFCVSSIVLNHAFLYSDNFYLVFS